MVQQNSSTARFRKKTMVFRGSRTRKRIGGRVKRGGKVKYVKRGCFIVSVPLLITGAIAAAKAAALGCVAAPGGVAVDQKVKGG